MENNTPKQRTQQRRWIGLASGAFVLCVFLVGGFFLWQRSLSAPREAPEAEKVLAAQVDMPFQVLIPAYLPEAFNRRKMEIKRDQAGPAGEAMIQLVYPTRQGITLVVKEWIPAQSNAGSNGMHCLCICKSQTQCQMFGMEVSVGQVRVRLELSVQNVLSYEQIQLIVDTLGPAANLQVYSSMESVPLSYSVPPATEVPVNAEGIQEITLIVTPQGYSPVHFSVKKDVPVKLIFRQLGEVGCGNELIFPWGERQNATLILSSPSDKQVLEFTPEETGEFRFNCPHQIYRGLMTVTD